MLTRKTVRIIFVVDGINRKSLCCNLFFGILQYISITKQLNWLHCFQFEYNYGMTQLTVKKCTRFASMFYFWCHNLKTAQIVVMKRVAQRWNGLGLVSSSAVEWVRVS